MAETNINAYFMDVEEKQRAFDKAVAELDAAEAALELKKQQTGWKEPKATEEESDKESAPSEEPKQGNTLFNKKK